MPVTGPGDVPAPPSGVASFEPQGVAGPVASILATGVFLHDGAGQFYPLSDVEWSSIRHSEGPDPSLCMLRVRQGFWAGRPDSVSFDAFLDLGRPARGLRPDDRICVAAIDGGGSLRFLFDGHVAVPGVQFRERECSVSYQATGVEARAFDEPLSGAVWRDADTPNTVDANVRTGLPARFNPGTIGNATDSPDLDAGGDREKFPCFLDPLAKLVEPKDRIPWTLEMAVRYILFSRRTIADGTPPNDSWYVELPDSDFIMSLFQDEAGDVPCPDVAVDRLPWPEALQKLIRPCGFTMHWSLDTVDGLPRTRLYLSRVADRDPVKDLYLQPAGPPGEMNPIVFGISNVREMSVERDTAKIVNTFLVLARPLRVEVGIMLAPDYPVATADADTTNLKKWQAENSDNTPQYKYYRDHVADEAGEGHWDYTEAATVTTPLDLKEIFPDNAFGRTYVHRRRKMVGTLFTLGEDKKPMKAALYLVKNYRGDVPGLYDGSGNPRILVAGNWRLLPDRIGVRITASDPNRWKVGEQDNSTELRGGVLNWVENQATAPNIERYTLLLATVIEGDNAPVGVASRRPSSPTAFQVMRAVDKKDRFRHETIHQSSPCGNATLKKRDDLEGQEADARARRAAHESAPQSGSVTIPWLTMAYQVGDRIRRLAGRGGNLNGSADANADPVYPRVVSRTWRHEARGVQTMLQIADHRGEEAWTVNAPPSESSGDFDDA